MLSIGCHISIGKGFSHGGKEAQSIGANTFQFFTRNPRGGRAKALDPEDLQKLQQLMKEEITNCYYIFHPGSHVKQGVDQGIAYIKEAWLKVSSVKEPVSSQGSKITESKS